MEERIYRRTETIMSVDPLEKPETSREVETDVAVAPEVMTEEEGQVIIHCICPESAYYRIWPSTFLVEHGTGRKAQLLTAFNVSFYPAWTEKIKGQKFTLIFEALSRSCAIFDLREIIPEAGGFEVNSIIRNETDVYTVTLGT
jgi:hypothetical protein